MADEIARRNTRQRQVVLEELRKFSTHPTAAQIYDAARQRLPKISLGTVYRNLELLVHLGVIRKVETTGAEARFDGEPDHHFHVRCIRCGRVADARGLPDDPVNQDVKHINGYEIQGFSLEFVGVCPLCQEESLPSGDPEPAAKGKLT